MTGQNRRSLPPSGPPPSYTSRTTDPARHRTLPHKRDSNPPSYSGSVSSSSPSRVYHVPNNAPYPNERAPLHPGITINYSSTRKGWSFKQVIMIFVILAIVALLCINAIWHKPAGEIDPIDRGRQRREWEHQHQREIEERERQRKQREHEREHKRQQDRQREEEEHRRREEENRRREEEEHRRREEENRRREEEHRRREEENRRRREEEQRREQERKRRDQERRDEKERIKLGMYWDEPTPAEHCASYGTREYTARIWNVPMFYDWLKACQQTPIVIHNKTIKTPDRCEDRGVWGGMHGVWLVDFNEMACLPLWGDFEDKGCTAEGSRLHRTESRLWNIQSGEDWKQMCATTPADLHGVHFDSPKYCDDRGVWGIYGVWELKDPNC